MKFKTPQRSSLDGSFSSVSPIQAVSVVDTGASSPGGMHSVTANYGLSASLPLALTERDRVLCYYLVWFAMFPYKPVSLQK